MPPVQNRFALSGVATGAAFTDRADERRTLLRALQTPGAHVLLTGRRRIGKTSLLLTVQSDAARKKIPVVFVDLWSASTIEDVTTRLVREASRVLGRSWADVARELAARLRFTLRVDEVKPGLLVPVPGVEFRDAPLPAQLQRLTDALEYLNDRAAARRAPLGIILDEFQELDRLGGGTGETMRSLRAAIQVHDAVTYVLSGSDRRLIERLTRSRGGALHNFGQQLALGPIPADHLSAWIEDTFATMGIKAAAGVGMAVVRFAGDRTRDVRTLAAALTDVVVERGARAVAGTDVSEAVARVLRERATTYEDAWHRLSAQQQNVLRAAAVTATGLSRQATRARFALGDTSRTVKALRALDGAEILLRVREEWHFDDPFFRAWVLRHAVPDAGLDLPIIHDPTGHSGPG